MAAFLSRFFRRRSDIIPTGPDRKDPDTHRAAHTETGSKQTYSVRLAVYDSLATVPRVIDFTSGEISQLLDDLANKTYSLSHERGGKIPYVAIKEIIENLMHAEFKEAVISILPDGNTIRVSDQGPGIANKDRAFLPGFTTATGYMKQYIRGVGSGLPIVKESLNISGGSIVIEDNLRSGCVVTLSLSQGGSRDLTSEQDEKMVMKSGKEENVAARRTSKTVPTVENPETGDKFDEKRPVDIPVDYEKLNSVLSQRQKKVFLLIADVGEAGPSTVVKELDMSLSTAYRDLVTLEEYGLLSSVDNTGKRKLTEKGLAYLSHMFQ
ncbi:MAG TPA: hypothetical protein GX509_01435 [Firmicutes bacterium]|nr:hypothetical protein [Bacillota bacterium]HHY97379.1 hypothetical protein [Bacillota bacterium]